MKQMIVVLAVAVLLSACGSSTPETPSSAMPVPGSDVQETVVESSLTDNIADLFRSGTAAKCTVTTSEGSATIYISGSSQRMDATTNGESMHSIVDSTTLYVWTDQENKGFKMSTRAVEDTANQAASQYQGQTPSSFAETPDARVQCGAWVVDGSKFRPPAGVVFEDLDAMMAQIQQMQQDQGFNPDDYN